MCYRRNKPYSKDSQKMRKVLRTYKKEIFPALTPKAKILYILSLYFPLLSKAVLKFPKH